MNIIEQIEAELIAKLTDGKPIPEFDAGDTVLVRVKVVEGTRERIQIFEGVCIARKNAGINSSFTVRKLSYGEGVERVFPLYSPRIEGIEIVRRGKVRRAKLYYLRGRTGKAARIVERTTGRGSKKVQEAASAAAAAKKAKKAEAKAEPKGAGKAKAEPKGEKKPKPAKAEAKGEKKPKPAKAEKKAD